ncbi:Exocyst complex component 7 [Diplonema papillatum]|nr:Exocyst complex component 7 [Diplonema papillatum]
MNNVALDGNLLKSLELLNGHINTMRKNKEDVASFLSQYDESTRDVQGRCEELNQRMCMLHTQLENIETTKRTVANVADKFGNLNKARAQLDKGAALELSELLASCDALREAVKYADSLSTSGRRGTERLQEQHALADRAAQLLDYRFRLIITKIKPVDWQANKDQPFSFLDSTDEQNLYDITKRMDGDDHLWEFFDALSKNLRVSVENCYSGDMQTLSSSLDADKKSVVQLTIHRDLLSAAQRHGQTVFGDDAWASYTRRQQDAAIERFCVVDAMRLWVMKQIGHGEKHTRLASVEKIYTCFDIVQHLGGAPWAAAIPDGPAVGLPEGFRRLAKDVNVKAVERVRQYLGYLSDPTEETPSSGTVYAPVAQTINLLTRICKHYGDSLFDSISLNGGLTEYDRFRDFFDGVVNAASAAFKKKAGALEDKKKNVLGIVFRLNNTYYLYRHLADLKLGWVDETYSANLKEAVGQLKAQYLRLSWGKVMGILGESPTGDRKEWLKKRLKSFNEGVEDRLAEERKYNIASADLRHQMHDSVIRCIVPQYHEFLKHTNAPFSRTPEKYLKYPGHSLEDTLRTLFNG